MPILLLPAAARIAKPWKNGGGVTTEVFVSPEGADLAGFQFRLSIAEVAGDGPFSAFPGIDRTTAILSGNGFELDFGNGKTSLLTQETAPFSYPGDAPAACRLLGGPTADLNAMSRRGSTRHRMVRHDISEPLRVPAATLAIVLPVKGHVVVRAGAAVTEVQTLDALLIRNAPAMVAPQPTASIFIITCGDAN